MIRIENLHKSLGGTPILRGVSLDVRAGELIVLIGRSGCGKSTLLRCLNGLEVFDEGALTIGDVSVQRAAASPPDANAERLMHDLRLRVGMVFQSFNLFSHLTVLENLVKAPMVVQNLSRDEAEARARKYLEKVGLSKFTDRFPSQLSGGQQQRAAIARALTMSPQVMLYDEPTSALDPELVDEVLQVMRSLDEEGMTQLVVTHEMRFARDAADYVVFLEEGRVVEMAPPEEMFTKPKDERARNYLKRFL